MKKEEEEVLDRDGQLADGEVVGQAILEARNLLGLADHL
jgi:hypothetical protein